MCPHIIPAILRMIRAEDMCVFGHYGVNKGPLCLSGCHCKAQLDKYLLLLPCFSIVLCSC